MFTIRKKDNEDLKRVLKLLEEHENQHTKEHWIVIALLAVNIGLILASYVAI